MADTLATKSALQTSVQSWWSQRSIPWILLLPLMWPLLSFPLFPLRWPHPYLWLRPLCLFRSIMLSSSFSPNLFRRMCKTLLSKKRGS
jgi:hypothetical protein